MHPRLYPLPRLVPQNPESSLGTVQVDPAEIAAMESVRYPRDSEEESADVGARLLLRGGGEVFVRGKFDQLVEQLGRIEGNQMVKKAKNAEAIKAISTPFKRPKR